jgi:hypothetical protein
MKEERGTMKIKPSVVSGQLSVVRCMCQSHKFLKTVLNN